jgi:hypothetical protein
MLIAGVSPIWSQAPLFPYPYRRDFESHPDPLFGAIAHRFPSASLLFLAATTGFLVFRRLGLLSSYPHSLTLLGHCFDGLSFRTSDCCGGGFLKYSFLISLYGLALIILGELTWMT